MNARPDSIPERSYIDRRIERAYDRMISAASQRWAYAWADVLYRYIMRRKK